MPIEKALEPHSLIVWQMNGEPLPHIHGGPLRLVVPGWPASLSSKWLKRILVRATPHDGQGMGGTSYRMPTQPIVPAPMSTEDQLRRHDLHAAARHHHRAGQWHPPAGGDAPHSAARGGLGWRL